MLARLDHLAQPQTLLMAADVLDFIGDRAAVGRAQRRQGLRQCLGWAGAIDAQYLGRNPRHDLGREAEAADVERRIAGRLRAEGVEVCGKVPKIPMSPNQGICGSHMVQIVQTWSREHGARSRRRRWGDGYCFLLRAPSSLQVLLDSFIKAV